MTFLKCLCFISIKTFRTISTKPLAAHLPGELSSLGWLGINSPSALTNCPQITDVLCQTLVSTSRHSKESMLKKVKEDAKYLGYSYQKGGNSFVCEHAGLKKKNQWNQRRLLSLAYNYGLIGSIHTNEIRSASYKSFDHNLCSSTSSISWILSWKKREDRKVWQRDSTSIYVHHTAINVP